MEKVPTIDSSSEPGKVGEHYPYSDSEVVGRVHVIVENRTYLDESLPDSLKNTIVEGYYDLTKDDSMMTVALKALDGKKYTWNRGGYDYGTTYLASVEKDGGYTRRVHRRPELRLDGYAERLVRQRQLLRLPLHQRQTGRRRRNPSHVYHKARR